MVRALVVACLFTVVVESPIVALVYRTRWQKMATAAAITTGLTNLGMNTVLSGGTSNGLPFTLVVGESFALFFEAFVYARLEPHRGRGRALIASAVANSASFGLGLLFAPWLFR
ncbi:MAG: hypothetical protein QM784_05350 [Polyangiaceae bacterium]